MSNVIIAGGSGFIGKYLAKKLISSQFNVKIITRKPTRISDITWDTVKKYGVPTETDTVINLCGRNIGEINPKFAIRTFYKEYLDDVYSSRIETTKLLVKSFSKNTKIFINASAIGFYKPSLSQSYTEDSPYINGDFFTRLVHDWEAASMIPDPTDVKTFQVRIGLVLGKDGGILRNLYPSHRLGFGGSIGPGNQWISWIHINDLVDLIHFLLTSSSVKNLSGPFNATAPTPVRQLPFSCAFSQSIGAPLVGKVPTPEFVMRLLLGNDRAAMTIEGQRVLPSKALAANFKFKFPTLEDALEEIYGVRPSAVKTD